MSTESDASTSRRRQQPPRDFYGLWPEIELVELGERAAGCYDEASSLEHRFCRALGLVYGCPPRHWAWSSVDGRAYP